MKTVGRFLRELVFPIGSRATIHRGPLRGCKYVVTEQSGWAPILGRWEPEAQQVYSLLIAPGEKAWDLGANTGIHSLLFSRLVGASGQVVAFEPLPVNVEQLKATCVLNNAANVKIVVKAVSDSCEPATFLLGGHDKQGSLVGIGCQTGSSVQVPCTTLDEAVSQYGNVDFMKIDIEGAESLALKGYSRVSSSYPTLAIEVHTPSEGTAVGRWLKQHCYRPFRLLDAAARAANGKRRSLVDRSVDPDLTWPDQAGIWGTILAAHPSRPDKVARLEELSMHSN